MRLIDADALPKYTGYALSADEVAMAVENAPTIDAVPLEQYQSMEATCVKLQKAIADTPQVVRCKDCVNFETGDWCVLTGARAREDGYCAWAERNEDEED